MCTKSEAVFCSFLPQLRGSRGGERLHVSGHGRHSARGGQAGGDQRERRSAGLVRDARGGGQLPVATCRIPEETQPFSEGFCFLTCLKKGT